MCGKNSKPGLVFLVLLFSLFLLLFWGGRASAETMYFLTESQMMQLDAIFGMLRMENAELRELLDESFKEVNDLTENSKKLIDELKEVKTSLTRAEFSLNKYAEDVEKTRSMAVIKTVLYTIGGFLVGGATGYIFGAF